MRHNLHTLLLGTFSILCGCMLLVSCDHMGGRSNTDSTNTQTARNPDVDTILDTESHTAALYDVETEAARCSDSMSLPSDTKRLLAEKGLELIDRMNRLAHSEEYLNLMTGASEIRDEIAVITATDYTKPREIYLVDGAAFVADTTDFIRNYMRKRTLRSVASMINGRNGTQSLAVTAMLQVDDAFRSEAVGHTVIFLYTYGSPYSVLVTYDPAEDGAVMALASFVKLSPSETTEIPRLLTDVVGSFIESDEISVSRIDLS